MSVNSVIRLSCRSHRSAFEPHSNLIGTSFEYGFRGPKLPVAGLLNEQYYRRKIYSNHFFLIDHFSFLYSG